MIVVIREARTGCSGTCEGETAAACHNISHKAFMQTLLQPLDRLCYLSAFAKQVHRATVVLMSAVVLGWCVKAVGCLAQVVIAIPSKVVRETAATVEATDRVLTAWRKIHSGPSVKLYLRGKLYLRVTFLPMPTWAIFEHSSRARYAIAESHH